MNKPPRLSVARLLRELLARLRTESWRRLFAGRLNSGQIEAWAPRMGEE